MLLSRGGARLRLSGSARLVRAHSPRRQAGTSSEMEIAIRFREFAGTCVENFHNATH
jgi:hypothetical protein